MACRRSAPCKAAKVRSPSLTTIAFFGKVIGFLFSDWAIYEHEQEEGVDVGKTYYYYNKTTGESVWENPLDEPYRQLFQKLKSERDAGSKDIRRRSLDVEAKAGDGDEATKGELSLVPRKRADSGLELITGIIGHRHSCLDNGVQEVEYLVKWSSPNETSSEKDTEWFLADVLWPEQKELIERYNTNKGLLMDSPKPSPRKLKRGEGTPLQDSTDAELVKLRRELAITKQSKEDALEELEAVAEELKHAKTQSQENRCSNVGFRKKLEESMDKRLEELRTLHSKELEARDGELMDCRQEIRGLEDKIEKFKHTGPASQAESEEQLRCTIEALEKRVEVLAAELKHEKTKAVEAHKQMQGAVSLNQSDQDDMSSQILELQEKCERVERQKARIESESKMLERMNSKLKEELDSELSMSFTIRQENGKLKIEQEQASREIERLKLSISRLRESDEKRKTLAAEMDEKSLQCEELMQRVSFLEGQLQVQRSCSPQGESPPETPMLELQMQIGTLESQNGSLKEKVAQLEGLKKKAEDDIDSIKERVFSLEESVSSEKRQNQRLEAEKSVLTTALERVKEELHKELASNESLRQSCSTDQESLRAEIRSLTTTTKSLKQELEQGQKRHASDLAEKREELEAAKGKIEHLRNQIESNSAGISETIERETANRLSAEQQLREITQELEQEKCKSKRISTSLTEVKAQLDEKENVLANLERKIITQQEEVDETSRTKDRLMSDNKVVKETLASMKDELAAEISRGDELRKELTSVREELDTAQRGLRKAEQEAESKRELDVDSMAELQQQLVSLETQNGRLEEEINVYKSAEAQYKSRNKELMDVEDATKNKLKVAQEELSRVNSMYTDLSAQLEAAGAQTQLQEEGSKKLSLELENVKERLQQSEQAKDALQQELNRLQSSVEQGATDAEAKMKSLEGENATLAQEKLEAKQKIQDLEERVADLQTQLTASSDTKDLEAKCLDLENALARCKDEMEFALEARTQKALTEKELALEELKQSYESKVSSIAQERASFAKLQERLSAEILKRRQIHNKLVELQGNIRVYCRVRPMLPHEKKTGRGQEALECSSERGEISVMNGPWLREDDVRFEFDQVFARNSNQDQVFEQVEPLTVSVLDGYNVCIFAYGQTGSGKTYTMDGSKNNPGVVYRSLNAIFDRIQEESREGEKMMDYEIKLSMLEIYNETIRDLLDVSPPSSNNAEKPKRLDIRQGEDGLYVPGLTQINVERIEQVEEQMTEGRKNRTVGAHNINAHSSRSHLVVTVTVVGKPRDPAGKTLRGKLNLIDLAGSERLNKTGASGTQLKEAKCINKSLSALGNVIQALGQPRKKR